MRTPEWFKKLAVPVANRIVYASDAYVQLKSTLVDLSPQLVDFERVSTDPSDLRLLQFARLIRPMSGTELRKVRIGSVRDGGYVMADDFDVKGAISIGVGSNVSWDEAIARKRIPVVMFDPTIRRAPAHVPGGRFVRVGLGNQNSSGPFMPLSMLMRLSNFPASGHLLLKIDVEGSEYAALAEVSESELRRFRQIVIEFHNLAAIKNFEFGNLILQVAQKLSTNHFPIHVHGNNFEPIVRFGDLWFPGAIEVTYLLKSHLTDARFAETVRHEADAPCDPRVSDFYLEGLCSL